MVPLATVDLLDVAEELEQLWSTSISQFPFSLHATPSKLHFLTRPARRCDPGLGVERAELVTEHARLAEPHAGGGEAHDLRGEHRVPAGRRPPRCTPPRRSRGGAADGGAARQRWGKTGVRWRGEDRRRGEERLEKDDERNWIKGKMVR
ncbi:hypothetical protein U9M48_042253 [Paspalum notatum var. saurae]|uniref:Uncharacterized protein n=1 Tax=Paspalum notatum var. saurae TaxID=547442 RepID=A0AAQ3XG00_PASNO